MGHIKLYKKIHQESILQLKHSHFKKSAEKKTNQPKAGWLVLNFVSARFLEWDSSYPIVEF